MQDPSESIRFDEEGLRHIPDPFWAKLPHANIFACIAPDLLHQLHKGVFKDHLVKWVSADDEAELDARMMRIPPYHGLRLFKKGITGVQQWTGNEYRQMERVFIGAIIPHSLAFSRAHAQSWTSSTSPISLLTHPLPCSAFSMSSTSFIQTRRSSLSSGSAPKLTGFSTMSLRSRIWGLATVSAPTYRSDYTLSTAS